MNETVELSCSEVARRLGIGICRVHQIRNAGQLKGRKTKLGWLYQADEVERCRIVRAMAKVKKRSNNEI